jgi:hypothetical protein
MVTVTIAPLLEDKHYAELYELVRVAETEVELKLPITAAAAAWGREALFD